MTINYRMTDTNTETLLDIVTRTSRTNNRNMKFYKKTLENMKDMDIRNNYKINGENMFEPFEQLLNTYKNNLILQRCKNHCDIEGVKSSR
jgi:hypothetical protein